MLFGGVGLVIVVVVVLVVVAVTGGGGSSGGGAGVTPLQPAILTDITSVSPSQIATVAKENQLQHPPSEISAPALTADGKPRIVYLGAEYCPYCGGERWAMIMAFSKFGTFHNLKQLTSSASDDPTSIPSFSFVGSTYTSNYVVFDTTEEQDVNRNPLQTPSQADAELAARYGGSGGIPFVDIGGKWVISGASFDVTPMQHLSHETVAQAIKTGSTKYAADIQSTAGAIISRLCNLTDGKPGNVCRYFPSVIGQ